MLVFERGGLFIFNFIYARQKEGEYMNKKQKKQSNALIGFVLIAVSTVEKPPKPVPPATLALDKYGRFILVDKEGVK